MLIKWIAFVVLKNDAMNNAGAFSKLQKQKLESRIVKPALGSINYGSIAIFLEAAQTREAIRLLGHLSFVLIHPT